MASGVFEILLHIVAAEIPRYQAPE
jgi:hypothetical protein